MFKEYSGKTIATFGLMSKCIKHYYLPKVQLHGKIQEERQDSQKEQGLLND